MDRICNPENLREAFWRASRGKRHRPDQQAFQRNLDDELVLLSTGIRTGRFPIGEYRRFTIFEPKERNICAAAFRERVLHHALMNVCGPYFEKWLVERTYACIPGRGQTAAVQKAVEYAGRFTWFLKCDIRKFFDSIPHVGLRQMLRRRLKDEAVLAWLDRILDTYCTLPGHGLPMGNLTSQHLANLYLDGVDRLPSLAGLGYVRYMDDFVIWSNDKEQLKLVLSAIREYVSTRLGLSLKESSYINRCERGMDFLGRRVFPWRSIPSRVSRVRFSRAVKHLEVLYDQDRITELDLQCRVTAMTAFIVQQVRSKAKESRARNQGHEVCRGFIAAEVGGTPQRIAVHQGVTAMTPGTGGTTTASASPARSTAGWTDGPDSRPASHQRMGTNGCLGMVLVGELEDHVPNSGRAGSINKPTLNGVCGG